MIRFLRNSIIEKSVKSNIFFLYASNFIIEKFSFLLPYEEDWIFFENFKIKKNSIIIDIGAHWGESAISFSKYYGNKIFCYEPNPFIFKKLKTKTKKLNVKLFNYGIGKKGRDALYVPCFLNHHLSLWASSNLLQLKKRITKYTFINAERIKYKKIFCFFDKISKFKNKVSIIKIDVEGLEYEVIKEINNIIDKDKPLIFIEYNESSFQKVYKFLKKKIINLLYLIIINYMKKNTFI